MGMFILHTMRVNDTLLSDSLEYSLIPRLSSPPPGNEGTGGGGGGAVCLIPAISLLDIKLSIQFDFIASLEPILFHTGTLYQNSTEGPNLFVGFTERVFSNNSWCGLHLGCVTAVVSSWGGEERC